MTFQDRCKEAAKRFLQTVVVIDDRLWDVHSEEQAKPGLKTPGVSASNEDQSLTSFEITTPHSEGTEKSSNTNPSIDTSCLAEAFASEELICGMIQPKPESPLAKSTIRAVSRADVVILDWDLGETSEHVGDMASQLLTDVSKNDAEGKVNRRRLFILYTGHASEIDAIRKTISNKSDIEWRDGNSCITASGLHILLWAKDGLAAPDNVPKVNESDLPGKVIEEFAKINEGLLSNVALSGLAAIRDNSHALLARFSCQLDPAFIAHRLYLPSPTDSEEHAVALLADEIHTILMESQAFSTVNLDSCCEFVAAKNPTLDLAGRGNGYTKDEWRKILESGLGNPDTNCTPEFEFLNNSKKKREKVHRSVASVSRSFNPTSGVCDEQFAALTALCQPYLVDEKNLTLGTIVREMGGAVEANADFLLCIQPPCDSVRLNEARDFPFLSLESVNPDKRFHLAVPFNGSFIRFKIDTHAYNCRMINFSTPEDHVKTDNGEFTSSEKNKFEWVAQLKWSYAQKVITEFASQACRVGIDQSEWLRRHNPGQANM